jgi:hypothetical protein
MIAALALAVELADAADLQLFAELASRGYSRWGCWATQQVEATWAAPTEGNEVVYYVVEAEGASAVGALRLERRYILPTADGGSLTTWWPSWVDSVRARAAGVDAGGAQGPWSEYGDWTILEGG